jgi:diaminopimelate epimerase
VADPEAGIAFQKGHGTENDFVLLPDPDGALRLTGARVRALCDRHRGLGADGVIRVVRTAALGEPVAAEVADTEWFMDYRNADGSVAEMCGNGVRVFARYLAEAGLLADAGAGRGLVVGTRGGPKGVRFGAAGEVSVDMGSASATGTSWARVGGQRFDGLMVDVGNPHLACITELDIDRLDLRDQPEYDPTRFPHGVNVEFVSPPRDGEVRMRVYERGVGETRSCGTGTVAAALAALRHDGRTSGELVVRVPGGRVVVEITEGGAVLTGPAVLLARGELSSTWWRCVDVA